MYGERNQGLAVCPSVHSLSSNEMMRSFEMTFQFDAIDGFKFEIACNF